MCKNRVITYIIKYKWVLLFAILYSILVSSLSLTMPPNGDSATYSEIGKNIAKGNGFVLNYGPSSDAPGFPMIIALSMILFGDFFIQAILAIMAFFLMLVFFNFTKEITNNEKIAAGAMIFLALTPLVFYNSLLLISDIPFLLFSIASMWVYARFLFKKNKKTYTVLWAILTGFSILIRYMSGFLLILIYIIHFLYLKVREKKLKLKYLVIFLLIIIIIILPFLQIIYNAVAFISNNRLTSSPKGHIALTIEGISEGGKGLNLLPIDIDIFVPIQVVSFLRICAVMLLLISPLVSLVFLYRLYDILKRKFASMPRFEEMLLLWSFAYIIFHVLYPGPLAARYLLPITPVLIIFFSRFIFSIWKKHRKLVILMVIIQLIISCSVIAIDSQTRWKRSQTRIFAEAGNWLKENTAEDSEVLCIGLSCTTINYYGDRKFVKEGTPEYAMVSDFRPEEMDIESMIKDYELKKKFSDDMYYVKIYKLTSH